MSKKKINILINKEGIVFYTIYPLIVNKKKLFNLGYDISFFLTLNDKVFDCDILILISKPTQTLIDKKFSVSSNNTFLLNLLKKVRKKVDKIIWLDNSDSSSVTNFEVMPFVDLYLKKQILKDKSLYSKHFYGGRIFTNFYHNKFNVEDQDIYKGDFPLKKEFYKKLRLAWNIGLGNVHNSFDFFQKVKMKFFPMFNDFSFANNFVNQKDKKIDIFFRGSTNYSRNTIRFHREELEKRLISKLEGSSYTSIIGKRIFHKKKIDNFIAKARGRLSNKEYKRIQINSKISFSPFGWGELGARDYETIIAGSLLIKPNLKHMHTWPDIFIPMESYIPIDWDFKNLDKVIDEMISNEKLRKKIILNSQDLYKKSISSDGMEKFCIWFLKQIKEKY